MKFTITKASNIHYENMEEKEFNTIEELINWTKQIDCDVIIGRDDTIMIYDDYIE